MSDKPSKPPTLRELRHAAKEAKLSKKRRGRPPGSRNRAPGQRGQAAKSAPVVHPKPADDTLFTLRLSRRLAKQEAADDLAKTLPKRQGGRPGPYGPYKSRGVPKRGDAEALAKKLDEDRTKRESRPESVPRCPDQERADAWVALGVRKLAMTCPPRNHVVLMAATCGETGKVGAGSSIQLSAMATMTALGRLVAEVNEAFVRDDVGVRVELRMHEVDAEVGFERSERAPRGSKAEGEL